MRKVIIKNNSYVCIQGWMINLGLKGTELMVYSIIYGFSQDGSSCFSGTIGYLMAWCNASKNTVLKALGELMRAGLITKTERLINGVKLCEYTALSRTSHVDNLDNSGDNLPGGAKNELVVQKMNRGGAKNEPVAVQKMNRGGAENEPNNINNILTDTLSETTIIDAGIADKCMQKNIEKEFETIWKLYPDGRRQGRKAAYAAFRRARCHGTSYQRIMAALEAYKQQIAAAGTPTQYIKHGGTWFSSEAWLDDYTVHPAQSTHRPCKNRALDYKQRTYTSDDFKALGISLGEDVYEG